MAERDFPIGPGPAEALGEFQLALHRRQLAAIRAERREQAQAEGRDERWPGVVPQDQSTEQEQ